MKPKVTLYSVERKTTFSKNSEGLASITLRDILKNIPTAKHWVLKKLQQTDFQKYYRAHKKGREMPRRQNKNKTRTSHTKNREEGTPPQNSSKHKNRSF